MRKRTSLRRWKARCRLGLWIPLEAIVGYDLKRWFTFTQANFASEYYRVRRP